MRMIKLLQLLASSLTFKWKCITCQITMENDGRPLKCPTCGRSMMAI